MDVGSCSFEFCMDSMGFTAKANNPKYQQDPNHSEASENVKIALPYVKTSITDAM